jgi:poly(3-hydroxybutyrate) depolymerase
MLNRAWLVTVVFCSVALPAPTSTAPSPTAAADKIVKETLIVGGRERTYYLYVPATIEPGAPAPLLITLHGSGHVGSSLVEPWKNLAKKERVVVVGPDSLSRDRWEYPADGPEFLHLLAQAISAKVRIDPRRMYLFGHSAGAVFGLQMGLFESRYFAAVAIHAGAFRDPGEFDVISRAKRPIPTWVYAGDRDRFFPLDAVRKTRAAFAAASIPMDVVEASGHTHDYYGEAGRINAKAWAFLAPRQLDGDPQYDEYVFR